MTAESLNSGAAQLMISEIVNGRFFMILFLVDVVVGCRGGFHTNHHTHHPDPLKI
jgi:hypothetical protein